MQVTVTSEQELKIGGNLYKVEYRATADMSYTPGRISGPPEDCYPAEGECDITSVVVINIVGEDDNTDYMDDKVLVAKCLMTLDHEEIEESLWESYHETAEERQNLRYGREKDE